MILVDIDVEDLPMDPEAALVEFDRRLKAWLEAEIDRDREKYKDKTGRYAGNYAPERAYVAHIIGFLEEFFPDDDITKDFSDFDVEKFRPAYNKFLYEFSKRTMRAKFRTSSTVDNSGMLVVGNEYKSDILELISKIERIVIEKVNDPKANFRIVTKINSLRMEILREMSRFQATLSAAEDLFETLGSCGEKVKPATDRAVEVIDAVKRSVRSQKKIPADEPAKQLPSPSE